VCAVLGFAFDVAGYVFLYDLEDGFYSFYFYLLYDEKISVFGTFSSLLVPLIFTATGFVGFSLAKNLRDSRLPHQWVSSISRVHLIGGILLLVSSLIGWMSCTVLWTSYWGPDWGYLSDSVLIAADIILFFSLPKAKEVGSRMMRLGLLSGIALTLYLTSEVLLMFFYNFPNFETVIAVIWLLSPLAFYVLRALLLLSAPAVIGGLKPLPAPVLVPPSPRFVGTASPSGIPVQLQPQALTGGAKAGYFCLGLFLNAIGVLIAWLVNRDAPVKSDAVKMSVIGFAVSLALSCGCVLLAVILGVVASGGF
jgi:hypothetical protein